MASILFAIISLIIAVVTLLIGFRLMRSEGCPCQTSTDDLTALAEATGVLTDRRPT